MRHNDSARHKPDGPAPGPDLASPSSRRTTPAVSVIGIGAFAVARVADTVITTPVLLAAPAAEANPAAIWIATTFGVGGYALASLLAIPLCVALIEGLCSLSASNRWSDAAVKTAAYTLLTAASAAAAVHNVRVLADVLPGVIA